MKNLVPFFRALGYLICLAGHEVTIWEHCQVQVFGFQILKLLGHAAPYIPKTSPGRWEKVDKWLVGEVEGKTPETMKEKPKKFMQRESWYSRKDVWKKLPKLPKSNIWNIEKILRRTQSLQQALSELSAPCTPNAWYACPGTNSSKRQPNLIWQT